LFSDTLTLCSSLKVRDEVSHPCKTISSVFRISKESQFCSWRARFESRTAFDYFV
jgi:hypothetical protein